MRLLCVGRHPYLADHIASVFHGAGVQAVPVVGLGQAAELAARESPDVVLCEYDLLATNPLGAWERDAALAQIPVVAVSLTRRPQEACVFDVNGIAGFLYLPTLDRGAALRTFAGLAHHARKPGAASAGTYSLPMPAAGQAAGIRS